MDIGSYNDFRYGIEKRDRPFIICQFWRLHVPPGLDELTSGLLSGVPDYFGRNKISSGGDLSHYSSASLYKSFLLFCLICVY